MVSSSTAQAAALHAIYAGLPGSCLSWHNQGVALLPTLQVRAVFEQLREPEWLVEDASQPIEQIHQQVGSWGHTLLGVLHACSCNGIHGNMCGTGVCSSIWNGVPQVAASQPLGTLPVSGFTKCSQLLIPS